MQEQSVAGDVQPKFSLGRLVATPNVINQIANDEIMSALSRHVRGDWGKVNPEDSKANENALQHGGRLWSVYTSMRNVKFYIITESDRSITTVLLPEEY